MKVMGQLICCAALVVMTVATAFAATPTSGALLTVTSSAGSGVSANFNIYDSQIHSGTVHALRTAGTGTSSCSATDATFPTDAYVLQGGSWTGCDAGDGFEVTDNNDGNPDHQTFGKADIAGFHIETHYICGGSCSDGVPTGTATCNTAHNICTQPGGNPDTGFLTITNKNTAAFMGTITLTGKSPITSVQSGWCPVNGVASDSFTGTLAASGGEGSSVVLALSNDSSNCGGFNATQASAGTVTDGTPTVFQVGPESFNVTTFNAGSNNISLTLLPIPVPAGPLGSGTFTAFPSGKYGLPGETPAFPASVAFGATNFPNQALIAAADVSALGNPVGMEFHLGCSATSAVVNCPNVLYGVQADFFNDGNSLPNPIGGVALLQATDDSCPDATNNIFYSYFSAAPLDGPIKGGGNPLGGCYATTFDPTATGVPVGSTSTTQEFSGFGPPLQPFPVINVRKKGSNLPLQWTTVLPNSEQLSLCPRTDGTTNGTTACTKPWVFVGTINVMCAGDALVDDTAPSTTTNGFLQFTPPSSYLFNLATGALPYSPGQCFNPVLIFDTGLAVFDQQQNDVEVKLK